MLCEGFGRRFAYRIQVLVGKIELLLIGSQHCPQRAADRIRRHLLVAAQPYAALHLGVVQRTEVIKDDRDATNLGDSLQDPASSLLRHLRRFQVERLKTRLMRGRRRFLLRHELFPNTLLNFDREAAYRA